MTALAGQAVLVTGANRGMGREYVTQLLDRGVAKVYAAAREPRTIDHDDPRVVALPLDVTDPASIAAAAGIATDVGVLINNAGIFRAAPVLDRDTTALRDQLEANLFGPLMMAATFADQIAERKGAIVNVSSILAWMPAGSYGVSKAALWNATNGMRAELAPRGVQVVGVYVGLVDTDMASFAPDAAKSSPADVIRQVLDGIESGASEVLADEMTRQVRAALNKPID
ncbi:SDR family oxidoreductase [Mycolicibacterium psychrotolerans]|uniref:SDR family oxidoreductase n=1 Tax=Mycolicibacterium psychrotolerans TaxID=216929 RepID=UPI003D66ABE6